ncbi:hypothetical protein AG1IA_05434 [Rhizoctonia solani AG-1 IA]|uniref:Uncharacterized protein n=1 Tax=Thanatephorus cucumeris (strain AG1-IA) TaxID=983506 RepID=L8WUU4_THACA|nr:hypothetical protein AG1IA_05434 [Rhizoctonia solani AG-1 IA]
MTLQNQPVIRVGHNTLKLTRYMVFSEPPRAPALSVFKLVCQDPVQFVSDVLL